ncbi:hypothetical protein [Streptomyces sp. NPDC056255]|uniref:hypothetical protein n=1 Tax=Streptomyces sp. NPDC056255 TaxID=3345764 RepID=UPI0035DB6186
MQTPLKPNAQKKVIGGLLCRVSAGGTRCPKAPKRTNGGLVRSIQNVLPKQNQVTQPQQNTQCQNGSCPTEAVKKLMDDASKAVREKLHGKEKETKRDPNGIYLFSQSAQSQGRSSSASDSGREYSG